MSAALQKRSQGFTLVELMVGVAVLAILFGVAVPSFKEWIQNMRIRNVAEAALNGMQRARAEAISRNVNVDFVLLADTASWNVTDPAGKVIDSGGGAKESKDITRTVTPAGATKVTFNNFGGVANTGTAFTQIDFDIASSVMAAEQSRDMRITIGVGGNARMCDPHATYGKPAACN